MALVYMDGFDHYAGGQAAAREWSIAGTWNVTTGRLGTGQCVYFRSGQNAIHLFATTSPTWIVGLAYATALPTDTSLGFNLGDGTVTHVYVRVHSGVFTVYRAGDDAVLGSGTTIVSANTWYYLELKATIHDTTGAIELRVNGNTEISVSGIDTRNGGNAWLSSIAFLTSTWADNPVSFDDLYICDMSGAVNTTFLGDVRVETLLPTGAGAETQWTPSAGSNYQNVDEIPPNGDTDYNKSNTVGQVDTYTMADLVSTTGVIYGVQKLNYVRKDNAGSRSVAPVLRIGGTDHVGASTSIGDSYVYTHEIEEVSPATLSAFTIAEVNAMEVGVQVTA